MSQSADELSNKLGAEVTGTVLDHPAGLFILFFTEMWERFSYYGMRALLVLFLVSEVSAGGWGWDRADALKLYGTYTGLVYLTPILGGWIADKLLGSRMCVVLGALVMTLGHGAMALETKMFFYIGLGLLIAGNGLFKPNISTIVGGLYDKGSDKKDSAYTIFYMGINAGAFLGILLCGYVGENVGWNYGFGLAGVFMFVGMMQFYLAQGIFGSIGAKPVKRFEDAPEDIHEEKDPVIIRDRLIVIGVLAFFTIFFWMAFEQAGGSMTIFAKDYTQRALTGGAATFFATANLILTVGPLAIITWVLAMLFKQTFRQYAASNIFLGVGFAGIWALVIWMLIRDYTSGDTVTVPASWMGILNSFFIIAFAPLFSKMWATKFNPSGPIKFAIGLVLMGAGFGVLAWGSNSIATGAATAAVSMWWLIIAYWLHTMGELCVSPVGLSYVSKLAPAKLMSLMFGIWFLSNAIANKLAGASGSYIDTISEEHGLSSFFLLFTAITIGAGILLWIMTPFLKKKMHGIH
ncbi:MAG: POT family proton-dependent oligopeptide transporter [Candidatus Krumholzibacteriia bacterium]|jgi:POT family proton-dependent oligopeptide transporter